MANVRAHSQARPQVVGRPQDVGSPRSLEAPSRLSSPVPPFDDESQNISGEDSLRPGVVDAPLHSGTAAPTAQLPSFPSAPGHDRKVMFDHLENQRNTAGQAHLHHVQHQKPMSGASARDDLFASHILSLRPSPGASMRPSTGQHIAMPLQAQQSATPAPGWHSLGDQGWAAMSVATWPTKHEEARPSTTKMATRDAHGRTRTWHPGTTISARTHSNLEPNLSGAFLSAGHAALSQCGEPGDAALAWRPSQSRGYCALSHAGGHVPLIWYASRHVQPEPLSPGGGQPTRAPAPPSMASNHQPDPGLGRAALSARASLGGPLAERSGGKYYRNIEYVALSHGGGVALTRPASGGKVQPMPPHASLMFAPSPGSPRSKRGK